jgi:hypothetical protein
MTPRATKPKPASRSLRAQARAIDVGLYGLAVGLYILPSWLSAGDRTERRSAVAQAWRRAQHPRLQPLLRVAGTFLGEQLGSPGQRLVGLRTVDARTGLDGEIKALRARYAGDSDELNDAIRRLLRERHADGDTPNTLRWLPLTLAMPLLTGRLRRALAPTAVVVAESSLRADES